MTQGIPTAAAVIVGGGSGSRFGGDKLTRLLAGKPLLAHTLASFEAAPRISEIVLVIPAGREEEFRAIARDAGISKLSAVVTGGRHRHESVLNGLNALPAGIDFVAIHDAARPLITPALIERTLEAADHEGAAAVAAPVTDTLHRIDASGHAAGTVDRSSLRAMQTPQVFRVQELIGLMDSAGEYRPTRFPWPWQRARRFSLSSTPNRISRSLGRRISSWPRPCSVKGEGKILIRKSGTHE